MYRRSRQEVFCKKGVLRNFAKSTGKHLFQSIFFNEVADLRPILTEHLRWLLLNLAEIWNLKNEPIKTLSHKISVTGRNIAFQRKRNC